MAITCRIAASGHVVAPCLLRDDGANSHQRTRTASRGRHTGKAVATWTALGPSPPGQPSGDYAHAGDAAGPCWNGPITGRCRTAQWMVKLEATH